MLLRSIVVIIIGFRIALFNVVSGHITAALLLALILNGFLISPEIISVSDIAIILSIIVFNVVSIATCLYLGYNLHENDWAILDYLSSVLLSAVFTYMVAGRA